MPLTPRPFGLSSTTTPPTIALSRTTEIWKRAGAAGRRGGSGRCRRVEELEARTLLTGFGYERFDLPTDAGSSAVAVADFNHDGMMDVATSNAGAGTISVLLNSASGFAPAVNINVGGSPRGVDVLDINDDTYPDIASLDETGHRIVLLTNNGDGSFAGHGAIALPDGATSAVCAHLNGDNSMEVVLAFAATDKVAVYRITDTGNPEAPTGLELGSEYTVGHAPSSITVGDVNRDGAPDILVTNAIAGTVSVLLNAPAHRSNEEFIGKLYKDMLGRSPGGDEVAQGLSVLAGEDGTLALARSLLARPEFVTLQVHRLFTQYLQRDPGQEELANLAAVLGEHGKLEAIKAALLSSDEYFQSRAHAEQGAFVSLVYADLLGRPVEPQKVEQWVAQLGGGLSREDLVRQLMDSPDYRSGVVNSLFEHFLHRSPSQDEIEAIFGNLDDVSGGGEGTGEGGSGGDNKGSDDFSLGGLLARLLGSSAYFNFSGGGTGQFHESGVYVVGLNPSSISVVEVNGDLKPDLAVANTDSNTVSVLMGRGDGTFEVGLTVGVGSQPVRAFGFFRPEEGFTLGTVNRGDDTVSAHRIHDGKVELLGAVKVGDQPSWAAAGNFSHDGRGGLAISNAGDGTVTIVTFLGKVESSGDDKGGSGYEDVAVPGRPDLAGFSDRGASDSDNITPLNNSAGRFLVFFVPGAPKGAFANIYIDGKLLGTSLVRSDEGHAVVPTDGVTVLADGEHTVTASLTIGGREGRRSEDLEIVIKSPRVEVNNADPNEPTNDDGSHTRARVDEQGHAIVTIDDGSGESRDVNLHDEFPDAPPVQGDLVVVDEVKHEHGTGAGGRARRYAAGQTSQGLMLFTNDDDGSWHERNLTDDVSGAEAFASDDLDVLTTPWGNSNIFGKNAQGELVAYWQDGTEGTEGFNWNFINLGEHLSGTGQDQPQWNSDIESYSVPWGGMNVIAVDANGDVTAVWWAPGLDHWVYSNLTEITGAEKLVGTVSVSVTPWGGVNVLGTNALGHTIALWWAPGYSWQETDMTLLANAPSYAAGTASSFSSISGDIVVAGLTITGDVAIFRWTLADQVWHVTQISPPSEITSALVGQLTGYANMNSELFVLGSNIDGGVVQFAYNASSDNWDISVL